MKRKTCLSFLVILILLSQCSKNNLSTQEPSTKGVLTWETSDILSTREWSECAAPNCYQHNTLIMEGLFRIFWKNGNWEPELALASDTDWIRSSYFIKIKKNIRWTDGNKLVADDFLRNWKKVFRNCQTLDRFPAWKSVIGLSSYCQGTHSWQSVHIKIPEPYVIQIETEKGTEALSRNLQRSLSHPLFFPLRDVKKGPHPTVGPFILSENVVTERRRVLSYLPNPSYYGGPSAVGKIVIRTGTPQNLSVGAVLSEQIQLAGPFTHAAGWAAAPPAKRLAVPTPKHWAVANFGAEPLLAALDWSEPQKLAASNLLPCSGTRLCALTEVESQSSKPPANPPVLWILQSKERTARALADNLSAQWRALYQGRIRLAPASKPPKEVNAATVVFPFTSNPLTSLYPSIDLFTACQSIPAPKTLENPTRWTKLTPPTIALDSSVRAYEEKLFKTAKCLPLATESSVYLRSSTLEGVIWTALGTWDLSRAKLPEKKSAERI